MDAGFRAAVLAIGRKDPKCVKRTRTGCKLGQDSVSEMNLYGRSDLTCTPVVRPVPCRDLVGAVGGAGEHSVDTALAGSVEGWGRQRRKKATYLAGSQCAKVALNTTPERIRIDSIRHADNGDNSDTRNKYVHGRTVT